MWNYNYGTSSHDSALQHARRFKYLKRERVNGRWRYYYKDNTTTSTRGLTSIKKYETANGKEYQKDYGKSSPADANTRYGTYTRSDGTKNDTLVVKKSDKLFSNTKTIASTLYSGDVKRPHEASKHDVIDPIATNSMTVKEIGKLERSITYGYDWLTDKLGLDEKHDLSRTAVSLSEAKSEQSGAQRAYDKASKAASSDTASSYQKRDAVEKEFALTAANGKVNAITKELDRAKEAYANTPIGKLESAPEKVADFIKSVFSKKKK